MDNAKVLVGYCSFYFIFLMAQCTEEKHIYHFQSSTAM